MTVVTHRPLRPTEGRRKPLRIAMIGARGLPARSGGVERHVEEVATRLAARGHDVTVFCRPAYGDRPLRTYRGVQLASLPTVPVPGGEAFVHSGLSTMVALGLHFDLVHFHALGPGLFTPLTRGLTRAAVVQTVHGLDDQRDKWGTGARRVLRAGRVLSAHVPDHVVVVSRALQRHYAEVLGRTTTYIGNGTPSLSDPDFSLLEDVGLRRDQYVVFVGRLVPEKDPLGLVRAFGVVPTTRRLVLVGETSGTDTYVGALRAEAAKDPRVSMVGARYGAHLDALRAGASLFVQPSKLEGLPIALLEAAAAARPVLVSDIAPHLEVLGRTGPGRSSFVSGDHASLVRELTRLMGASAATEQAGADQWSADVRRRYDWDTATDLLEEVYERAMVRRHLTVDV